MKYGTADYFADRYQDARDKLAADDTSTAYAAQTGRLQALAEDLIDELRERERGYQVPA
jgi:hypothetical protein